MDELSLPVILVCALFAAVAYFADRFTRSSDEQLQSEGRKINNLLAKILATITFGGVALAFLVIVARMVQLAFR